MVGTGLYVKLKKELRLGASINIRTMGRSEVICGKPLAAHGVRLCLVLYSSGHWMGALLSDLERCRGVILISDSRGAGR